MEKEIYFAPERPDRRAAKSLTVIIYDIPDQSSEIAWSNIWKDSVIVCRSLPLRHGWMKDGSEDFALEWTN